MDYGNARIELSKGYYLRPSSLGIWLVCLGDNLVVLDDRDKTEAFAVAMNTDAARMHVLAKALQRIANPTESTYGDPQFIAKEALREAGLDKEEV